MHIPNLLLVVSNNKLDDWFVALVPFPNNIWLLVKLVVPIPPRETVKVPDVTLEPFKAANPLSLTVKVPDVIFDAFKLVYPEPEPIKLVANKVLVVLFQVKFADWEKINDPFPIKIWFAFK